LAAGQRADLVVLEQTHPDLYGKRDDQLLDSLIFCRHGQSPVRDVMAGGRWLVRQGRHASEEASALAYRTTLQDLLAP
jgi:formimidoylglutamate deiminase